jgi:hypothetical protein
MTSAQSDLPGAPATHRGTKLETAGWGVFLIWVGVCFLAGVSWEMFFLGTGLLMLASQAIRRYLGLRADWFGLAMGTCFVVVAGIHALGWRLDEITMPGWFVPALFIGVGSAFIVSAWRRGPKS